MGGGWSIQKIPLPSSFPKKLLWLLQLLRRKTTWFRTVKACGMGAADGEARKCSGKNLGPGLKYLNSRAGSSGVLALSSASSS